MLIVGAGRAGEMLVRDMLRDQHLAYFPVAFVDDKLRRRGGEVHGIQVRGSTDDSGAGGNSAVDLILLAIPRASTREMQRLVDLCEQAGKPFRTVPQLQNLMTGQVSINQVRPVSIEDLLGRNPVQLDWDGIRKRWRTGWSWSPGAGVHRSGAVPADRDLAAAPALVCRQQRIQPVPYRHGAA